MIITPTIDTDKCPEVIVKALARFAEDSQSLAALARHPSFEVRYCVAENAKTSQDTLSELANDKDWRIRLNVAYNPKTSQDTLSNKLANDESVNVQQVAKRHLKFK